MAFRAQMKYRGGNFSASKVFDEFEIIKLDTEHTLPMR